MYVGVNITVGQKEVTTYQGKEERLYAEQTSTVYDISKNPEDSVTATATLYDNGDLIITGTGEMRDFDISNSSSSSNSGSSTDNLEWINDKSRIRRVEIEEGVTNIGACAFYGCWNLTSINIPDSVTTIGTSAFYGCSKLQTIVIPKGITEIDRGTFRNCSNLEEMILFGNITDIADYAFDGCTNLQYITLMNPDEKIVIAPHAFDGVNMKNLRTYTLGKRPIQPIQEDAVEVNFRIIYEEDDSRRMLSDDDKLRSMLLETGTLIIERINEEEGDKEICMSDFEEQEHGGGGITSPLRDNNDIKKVIIGNGVTNIGNNVFYGCTNISSVIIPNSVKTIGEGSFLGCTGLKNITIPSGVTAIKENAFEVCSELKIKIPNTVNNIADNAFADDMVIICEETSKAEEYAKNNSLLYGYEWDISKTEDDNVTAILYGKNGTELLKITGQGKMNDQQVWRNYRDKIFRVEIEEGITNIGSYAFQECNKLTSIEIPSSVRSIGRSAFEGCSQLTSIKISDSVTSIGASAFRGCSELTSINIPEGVISIGSSAFRGCSKLTGINIPEGVINIGSFAFYECSELRSINIPEGVLNIGMYAFSACSKLTNITVDVENTKYKSTEGVLFNKEGTEIIQYPAGRNRTTYTVPTTVTSIGSHAFFGCEKLTSVIIPEGVTSIGNSAFCECSGLTSIKIPETVTDIGYTAFYQCGNLKEVIITNKDTQIEDDAFTNCNKDIIIYCREGSKAELYAKAQDIKYDYILKIESITGNSESWVNKDVTLTVNIINKGVTLHEKPYSFDGGKTWQEDNEKTYKTSENNIQVQIRDNKGYIVKYQDEINVLIDKTSPTLSVNVVPQGTTSAKLEIVSQELESGGKSITINNTPVKVETTGIKGTVSASYKATQNGTYTIRVTDNAGNYKEETVTVDNIKAAEEKKENPIEVSNKTINVGETINLENLVQNAQGALTYSINSQTTTGSQRTGSNLTAGVNSATDDDDKKVVVTVTAAGNDQYKEGSKDITITVQKYTRTLKSTKTVPDKIEIGNNKEQITVNAQGTGGTQGNITYSSSNTDILEIDETTGQITPKKEGKAQIIATMKRTTTVKGASINLGEVTVVNKEENKDPSGDKDPSDDKDPGEDNDPSGEEEPGDSDGDMYEPDDEEDGENGTRYQSKSEPNLATSILPKTGNKMILFGTIGILGISAILSYVGYRKYRD